MRWPIYKAWFPLCQRFWKFRSVSVSVPSDRNIWHHLGGPLCIWPVGSVICRSIFTKRFISLLLFTYARNSEKEKEQENDVSHSSWLARFNRKMSFQFWHCSQSAVYRDTNTSHHALLIKMADDEKNFTFQFVPNKTFPGFESSEVKELFMKW